MSAGVGSQYYSAFNPLDIGGCSLWLDAADPSTLTLSGSNVTQWRDKSGNGYNLSQSTTSPIDRRPTYSSNRVIFNGSNFLLTNSAAITDAGQTIIAVASHTGTKGRIFQTRNTYQQSWIEMGSGTLDYGIWLSNSGINIFPSNVGSSVLTMVTLSRNGFTSNLQWNQNGGTVLTPALSYTQATTGVYAQSLSVGSDPEGANFFLNGPVCELLLYSGALSTDQRQLIEGYLSRKWFRSGFSTTIVPFAPTQISGCQLWLDAADSNTVSLSGSNVTTWIDKSGARRDASASGVPVYTQNFVNNLPAILFNGTNSFFTGSLTNTGTQASFFTVVRLNTGIAQYARIASFGSNNATDFDQVPYYQVYYDISPVRIGWGRNSGAAPANIPSPALDAFHICSIVFDGSTGTTYIDGGVNSGSALSSGSFNISQYRIGGANLLNTTQLFSGYNAEVISYSTALTTTQRQQVEGYLAMKWGLQSSLPSTHPYALLGVPTTHPYFSITPITRQFAPIDIPGCALWLDAADPNSMTLSGSSVIQWNDKSGNGRNTSSLTGTATLGTNSVNGRQGVYFNGTSYFTGSFSYSSNTLSWFVVGTIESDGEAYGRLLSFGTSGQYDYDSVLRMNALAREASTTEIGSYRNVYIGRNAFVTYGTPFVYSSVIDGTSNYPYFNGTLATGAATSGNFGFSSYGISSSVGLNIQRNKGHIFEIIVYSSALTTSQRQQVEGYLAKKWGLVGSTSTIVPFIPTQISGCALWLDGSDPNGNSIVPTDGTAISTWVDKSSNAWSVTQSTAGNRPVYNASSRAIRFTGSSSNFIENNSININLGNSSLFVVCDQLSNQPYYQGILAFRGATTTGNDDGNSDSASLNCGDYINAGGNFLAGWALGGVTGVYITLGNTNISSVPNIVQHTMSNLVISSAFNGNPLASTSSFSARGTSTRLRLGARSYVNYSVSGYFTGNIYEIILYNSPISSLQRQQIEGYLANKWGISSSLPSSHPYVRIGLPSTHPFISRNPRVAVFNPRQISGCQIWLDGADPNSMTFSGSNITQWNDKSGNSRNATVTSGTTGPSYVSNTLQFRSSVPNSFDLPQSFANLFVSNDYTLFIVGKRGGGGQQLFLAGGYAQINSNIMFGYDNSNISYAFYGTGSLFPYANYLPNVEPTRLLCFAGSSTSYSSIVNGTTIGTSNASGRPAAVINLRIGRRYDSPNIAYMDFDVNEIVAYSGVLSVAQRQQVEGYLGWKWGLIGGSLSTSTPFTPTQISGCSLWLDAADSTTFSFSSGSNISQWRDKSSNAFIASVLNSPTLLQNNINNLPAVSFNGTNQYMNFGNVLNMGTSQIFVFVVSKFDSTANGGVIGKASFRGNAGRWFLVRDAGSMAWGIDPVALTANFSDTNTNVRLLTGYWDRSTSAILEDGNQRGSVSAASSSNLTNTDPLYIGAYPNSTGSGPQAGYFFLGKIAEVIVYIGTLTTTQRQQVESYLLNKWGIVRPLTLPSAHAYKLIKP